MKSSRIAVLAALFAAGQVWALDGTVRNVTENKPQAGAHVSLLQMTGTGPQKLAETVTGADGSFTVTPPADAGSAPGPRVVQATFGGVTYTKILPPGTSDQNVSVEVYNSSNKPGAAKVGTHMMLLEPTNNQLNVSESFVYSNPGNVTFNDPTHGTLRFFLPAATEGRVDVRVLSPNSMPIRRPAQKTSIANVYQLDFPIKPGDSRIDLTYQMPWTAPGKFETKLLYPNPDTKVLVPEGVKLVGNNLKNVGQEPRSKALIYDYSGSELFVDVEGTGQLARNNGGSNNGGSNNGGSNNGGGNQGGGSQGGGDQGENSQADDNANNNSGGGSQIAELFPQLYGKASPQEGLMGAAGGVKWILLMIFSLLALGFAYLYRRGEASPHERGR